MDDRTIKIEVDITFEELHRQNKFQLHSSKPLNIISFIIYILFLLIYIVLLIIGKKVMLPLLLWVLFIALQPLSNFWGSKRLYRWAKGRRIFTISDYGVICEKDTAEASFRYRWKDIRKVQESEDAFIFFPSFAEFSQFFIIPKRCFTDERQILLLKELLENNVKKYMVMKKAN